MKLKDLLKESMVWERNFGEPLPTLDSVMEKYQQEGGKGSGRKPEKGSAKDIEKKSMKAATDANAKMAAAEKEMERKAKEQAFKDMANEGQQTPVLLKRLHKLAGEFLLELHHFKNELKYVDDNTAKAYYKVFTKTENTIDRFIVNVLGSSRLKKISKSPLMASKRKKG